MQSYFFVLWKDCRARTKKRDNVRPLNRKKHVATRKIWNDIYKLMEIDEEGRGETEERPPFFDQSIRRQPLPLHLSETFGKSQSQSQSLTSQSSLPSPQNSKEAGLVESDGKI